MKVECPRSNTHPSGAAPRWQATGEFNTNARGLRRAVLRCLVERCGCFWSSALPDAIAAGQAAAADPENAAGETALPAGVCVPQPSLPMPMTRGGDFVSAKQLTRSVQYQSFLARVRARAAGER